MNVLLTGATRGLGRNAVQWLLEAGHQVHAIGRDISIGETLRAQGATFTALDLTRVTVEQCQSLMRGCEVVWHCAAKSSPWGSRDAFHQANTVATQLMAESAGRAGVGRFIHISTPAIYFDFQHHHEIDERYHAPHFANHYASSKYAAEMCIRTLVPRYPDTTYVILRPRGLFGPHDRVILPRVLSRIEQDHGVLRLPGGGNALLDLTFVLNVVHAMDLASHHISLPSGAAYNITNHQPMRLADMLHLLLHEQLGLRYRLQPVPYRLLHALAGGLEFLGGITGKEPPLTRYSVAALYFDMTLSQALATEELGYTPRYTMKQGIEQTGAWFRQQRSSAHG
jgi:nucleoside-diphosphate-sugar epimerase